MLQSLSALTLQQCDTATAASTITGHVSHDCATASDRRSHTRNATPLSHCNAAVTHACTQRSETHKHKHANNRTQRCAVTHPTRRDAVQQSTRDNTNPQSQYCVTALETAPAMHTETHILHRAYDAATIRHIFAGATRTSRTCRLAPRSPTPHHTAHTRADTHDATSSTQHNTTSASWPVSPKTARAYKGTSHTNPQHTNTQVRVIR